MKHSKLNYRFHDPNLPGIAAAYILRELINANQGKVERAIQSAAENTSKKDESQLA